MRVILDTNIIVSALIGPAGNPATALNAWLEGKFTLLTLARHKATQIVSASDFAALFA